MAQKYYRNGRPARRSPWVYNVIVKCWPAPRWDTEPFKKWRTSNLVKFVSFLRRVYPNWCYMNVYSRPKDNPNRGYLLGSFTKNNLPRVARPFDY